MVFSYEMAMFSYEMIAISYEMSSRSYESALCPYEILSFSHQMTIKQNEGSADQKEKQMVNNSGKNIFSLIRIIRGVLFYAKARKPTIKAQKKEAVI
jgi:hypothetical protein